VLNVSEVMSVATSHFPLSCHCFLLSCRLSQHYTLCADLPAHPAIHCDHCDGQSSSLWR